MRITKKWLIEKYACEPGLLWFCNQSEINPIKIIKKLMLEDRYEWGSWLITNILTKKDNILYAIFAAEKVLHIFEEKYPNDKRPRKAIEVAKKYLSNFYASAAADAAAAAAVDASDAAYIDDATAAADAAAAAYSTAAAVTSDYITSSVYADSAYADSASAAAYNNNSDYYLEKKIINYGIDLLKKQE